MAQPVEIIDVVLMAPHKAQLLDGRPVGTFAAMREGSKALLLLGLASCRPDPPPISATDAPGFSAPTEPVTDPDPPGDPAPVPPAEPDPQAVRTAAKAAASAAGVQPTPRGPGPVVAARQPGRRRVADRWAARDLPGPPRPVDYVRTYVTRAPWAEITEAGELVVRWWTADKAPPASLYLGMRVEEDPLAPPRYREHVTEGPSKRGRQHEIRYRLADLLRPRYDVNGVAQRGYGEVSWRLEGYDAARGRTVLLDGRTAFRIEGERFVQQPTIVLGPLVHRVSSDGLLVSFDTDVPTAGAVVVGDRLPVVTRAASTHHVVEIRGLQPGRAHRLQAAVSDGVETSVSPVQSSSTRAETGPVTIAIMSDSRSGPGPGLTSYTGINAQVLHPLVLGAYRRGAEAVFFPGDLVDGYSTHPDEFDWQLRSWLHVVEPIHASIPFYTGMGNHEALVDAWSGADQVQLDRAGEGSAEARFAAIMVNPPGAPEPERDDAPPYDETVYGVDLGPVHLVMLNTNYWYAREIGHPLLEGRGNREGMLMERQLQWLDRDLQQARARGARHLVVMGHEPAFPVGGHTKDAMWWNGAIPEVNVTRERFWKILAHHGVVAYVSGDEHNYSRALIGPETVPGAERAVYSIISGGCGAPYYALDPPAAYAQRVQAFSAQQHYTLWTFDEHDAPRLRVVGLTDGVIEDVRLRGDGG